MKQIITEITLLIALVLFCYHIPQSKRPPRIPDKVEIRYKPQPRPDSLRQRLQDTEYELAEMQYYLRVHDVTDEGYNLVASYNATLEHRKHQLQFRLAHPVNTDTTHHFIKAKDRLMPAVKTNGGYWRYGHFHIKQPLNGKAIVRDSLKRIVLAVYDADTIIMATRHDTLGTYRGQMNIHLQAFGQGTYDACDGAHYEGFFQNDQRHGFGFESSPHHQVRIGAWKEGRFLGEKIQYTNKRIYGIDISRYQHEQGRKRFAINWRQLRITSLGKRHDIGGRTFPVSFIYIKSTESTSIRNRYFLQDYTAARARRIPVGAYHFFSLQTTPEAQATYFVNHTLFRKGDFPPVLDVEPSDAQIQKIGGDEELMRRIRIFMEIVERRTGMRPILYISQMFINQHMKNAADIKQKYNVWIARYGEYKPDVKLVYWQLCADGHVNGIKGAADINVFNGYQGQWDEFVRTGFHR